MRVFRWFVVLLQVGSIAALAQQSEAWAQQADFDRLRDASRGDTTPRIVNEPRGTAIPGANAISYTVISSDIGQALRFEVTPIATAGVPEGNLSLSDPLTIIQEFTLNYSAGTGLTLGSSNTFSLTLSYQLPQTCNNDQIIRWRGTAWACADDQDTNVESRLAALESESAAQKIQVNALEAESAAQQVQITALVSQTYGLNLQVTTLSLISPEITTPRICVMLNVPVSDASIRMPIRRPTSPILVVMNAFLAALTADRRFHQKPMRRYEQRPTSSQAT